MTVATPRVLLISESRITRRVVEMTFADQQVDLVTAGTGQAGLAAWNERPAAVVLADLTMDAPPDGLALARHVHANAGGRPVAVLLLAGPNETLDEAAAAGAHVRGVIRKPLDSLQLIEAVRGALRAERPAPWSVAPVPERVPEPVPEGALVATSGQQVDAPARLDASELPQSPSRDQNLERVAAAATSEAAERLVRELAPALVAEVARLVVADVSERLVREEIARMRATPAAR